MALNHVQRMLTVMAKSLTGWEIPVTLRGKTCTGFAALS
jgi:hypothetical protein